MIDDEIDRVLIGVDPAAPGTDRPVYASVIEWTPVTQETMPQEKQGILFLAAEDGRGNPLTLHIGFYRDAQFYSQEKDRYGYPESVNALFWSPIPIFPVAEFKT